MKKKIIISIGVGLLLVLVVGLAVAQIGTTVPVIPSTFTINLGQMPPPLPNQKIGVCDYEEGLFLKQVQVWSNEEASLGQANITYSFQIGMPHCSKSYHKSFTYSVLANPVTALEANARQTVLTSIAIPQPTTIPIATGGMQ